MRPILASFLLAFGLNLCAAEFATTYPWPTAEQMNEARADDSSVRIHHTPGFIAIQWQDHSKPETLGRLVALLMPRWKEASSELIRLHRKMLDLGSNTKLRHGETVAQLGYHRTFFTVVWPGTPAERNTLIFENIRPTRTVLSNDE
ncbi:MAG: hypothetical protein ACI8W8_000276 [Rhodothermales bacterium]|jgi:hypothetical protein